ncbi:DUF3558 family protein [Nocardia sp. NPDC060256]|uniref:DUF3558 family protein n=1 Tax=unclassified Nocardia TaxID=2637762 RepID=UPI0036584193
MGALVVAVGAAVLLAGCGSSSTNGQPAPGNSQAPTTAVVESTSAGSVNPPAGSEDSNTASPNATAAPAQQPATAAPAALWDPCGIAAADITKVGFRPDGKTVLTGSDSSGDSTCRWPSVTGKSELTIVSTRKTVQDFIQTGRYVDVNPVPIRDRAAYQFHAAQDTNKIGCYIGVTVPSGLAVFVTRNLQPDAPQEPCAAARRIGEALVGYLP